MDGISHQHPEADADLHYASEPPPLVRFDERRMHVRAYNYWASLLGDRTFPSIEDLDPGSIEDFGSHSVLLDFTGGVDDPAIAFLGSALREECGFDHPIERISDVPARTLLSRLTDHYLQILANEAPIGFEAEFTNQRGSDILYRGILMPFSSDDDSIDFIYGVINWKEVAAPAMTDDIARAIEGLDSSMPPVAIDQIWGSGALIHGLSDHDAGETDPDDEAQSETDELILDQFLDPFARSLNDARTAAAEAFNLDGRSRAALYRAIGLAHSFALLAAGRPDDYADLLAHAGIQVPERSPMTALVKLIFGVDHDKTRLSEYASAITHAMDTGVVAGALESLLASHAGGLKAYIRAARTARGGAPASAPRGMGERLQKRLRKAALVDLADIATDDAGFALVLMRREADGSLSALGALPGDDKAARSALRAITRRR